MSSEWSPKDRTPETNSEYANMPESEELFKLVANAAPVLVWMADTANTARTSTGVGWTLPANRSNPSWGMDGRTESTQRICSDA